MFRTKCFASIGSVLTAGCCAMLINEPHHEKRCLMPYANNKCADQPAHPRSLIFTIVVSCLGSFIIYLQFLYLQFHHSSFLFSVAERAGSSLSWSHLPEDRFSRDVAQIMA